MFVSWKTFLSVVTQPEGITIEAKDSTLSSLSNTAFNHPSSAVGQIAYSTGLSLCLKERGMELELTGVRVKDSKVHLAFVGFLPFVPPPLPHFPHGKVSALWQQCRAALL